MPRKKLIFKCQKIKKPCFVSYRKRLTSSNVVKNFKNCEIAQIKFAKEIDRLSEFFEIDITDNIKSLKIIESKICLEAQQIFNQTLIKVNTI